MENQIIEIKNEHFDHENHFYPKALNAHLHPMVTYFLNMKKDQIIERYLHLHPKVDRLRLSELMKYECKHFYWGGADLFYTTTENGNRKMVVLETNSCPSGQKSMPMKTDDDEYRGYKNIIEKSFLPALRKKRLPRGGLAVVFDKNYMEVTGYATTLADLTGETVYLVPSFDEKTEHFYFNDGIMYIKHKEKDIPIRAAFRYVTQRPWNRIPTTTKTFIYNSILCCLSGGRNKLVANKAYELFNAENHVQGISINTPETIKDVTKLEVPLWITKFGGKAVVKDPYSNAGQGVYTVTSEKELKAFLDSSQRYDQFIIQNLIGHYHWSSHSSTGKYYHIGTLPDKKGNIYIADLRMMAYNTSKGFEPCAIYARKAKLPLTEKTPTNSWDVLGTNLSIKKGENKWETDTKRLILMDRKDFNLLGIGLDDLIEAYIQTIFSMVAIDKMACTLINKNGKFKIKLFKSLDKDESLINEIKLA